MRNKKWEADYSAIDDELTPQYSKAYLKHLFKAKEYLAAQIASEHNLKFYLWLVTEARNHILADTFLNWKNSLINKLDQRL
jgi:queuine tRNA-ribosyltransferase